MYRSCLYLMLFLCTLSASGQLFRGRRGGGGTDSQPALPVWVTQPKFDDSLFMYRVGKATGCDSEVDARRAAFDDAVRQIAHALGDAGGESVPVISGYVDQSPGSVYTRKTRAGFEGYVQVRFPRRMREQVIREIAARPPSSPATLDANAVFRKAAPGTVTIHITSTDGQGHGSGFFVTRSGYLLTNAHVTEGASQLVIETMDGRRLPATLVDAWPEKDIAILKVQGQFQSLSLSDSDTIEIGSPVVAIGTPTDPGLGQSITQGIISGKRMLLNRDMLQTSALINKGNSGGPLLDRDGRVVGINTMGLGVAAVSREGSIGSGIQGINFSVAINEARTLLRKNGITPD